MRGMIQGSGRFPGNAVKRANAHSNQLDSISGHVRLLHRLDRCIAKLNHSCVHN